MLNCCLSKREHSNHSLMKNSDTVIGFLWYKFWKITFDFAVVWKRFLFAKNNSFGDHYTKLISHFLATCGPLFFSLNTFFEGKTTINMVNSSYSTRTVFNFHLTLMYYCPTTRQHILKGRQMFTDSIFILKNPYHYLFSQILVVIQK